MMVLNKMNKSILVILVLVTQYATLSAQDYQTIARKNDQKFINVNSIFFAKNFTLTDKGINYNDYVKGIDENEKKVKWQYSYVDAERANWREPQLTTELKYVLEHSNFYDKDSSFYKDPDNTLFIGGTFDKATIYKVFDVPLGNNKKGTCYKATVEMSLTIKDANDEVVDTVKIIATNQEMDSLSYRETLIDRVYVAAIYQLIHNEKMAKHIVTFTFNLSDTIISYLPKPIAKLTNTKDANTATVTVKTIKRHSSGFAITNDGYILTSLHHLYGSKIINNNAIEVILSNDNKVKAKFIKGNKKIDIALIKVESGFEKCFEILTEKKQKVFEEVYTIGTPSSIELGQSAAKGIISSERIIDSINLIQLNMNLNKGNSGGPLFNENAVLYGIVTSKLFGFGVEGIAFAIPAYKLKEYLHIDFK